MVFGNPIPQRTEIDRGCPRGGIIARACGNPVLVDLLSESRNVKRGWIFLVMMSQFAYNFIYTAITKGFSEVGRFKLPDIVTAFGRRSDLINYKTHKISIFSGTDFLKVKKS